MLGSENSLKRFHWMVSPSYCMMFLSKLLFIFKN